MDELGIRVKIKKFLGYNEYLDDEKEKSRIWNYNRLTILMRDRFRRPARKQSGGKLIFTKIAHQHNSSTPNFLKENVQK